MILVNRGVSKKSNVGTLLRSMTAFNAAELGWVGSNHRFSTFGAHGAAAFVPLRRFDTLEKAREHYTRKGCEIIGVEITSDAVPVQSHPFKGDTVFLLGEEGHGLRANELAICDKFVYIPQYGNGTASLNVVVAASIVLQHFASWSGMPERGREGYKFVVEGGGGGGEEGDEEDDGDKGETGPKSRPVSKHRLLMLEADVETQEDMDKLLHEQRRERKEMKEAEDTLEGGIGLMDSLELE